MRKWPRHLARTPRPRHLALVSYLQPLPHPLPHAAARCELRCIPHMLSMVYERESDAKGLERREGRREIHLRVCGKEQWPRDGGGG